MQNEKLKMAAGAAAPVLLIFQLSLLISHSAHAEIPEPDNLLYGSITLDNVPVTAARTDVVIEARRTTNGPALASYRMGSKPALGNLYSLNLALESVAPVTNSNASQVGDSVIIIVRDNTGLRGQTTYTFPERGNVQRVDFGTPNNDTDGNGLPDAWEIAHFGSPGQNPNAINPNGQTTLANFVAGSAPNSTNTLFSVSVTTSGNQRLVSFLARRAEGPGYEGRSRFYSLETSTNLNSPSWTGLGGFTNIPGTNQTVTYPATATRSPEFYRGRVSLQGR